MIWLELVTALLAGAAAGLGWLVWRRLDRPQPPVQTEEQTQEDIRLRAGLANLLSYEIPQKEEP